jgi:hypothetical protein
MLHTGILKEENDRFGTSTDLRTNMRTCPSGGLSRPTGKYSRIMLDIVPRPEGLGRWDG